MGLFQRPVTGIEVPRRTVEEALEREGAASLPEHEPVYVDDAIIEAYPAAASDHEESRAGRQLFAALSALQVDEILGLCYALRGPPGRLRLYLQALRRRGGERAQLASYLVCFDLARQGDPVARRELLVSLDALLPLAGREELVDSLTRTDPYLAFLWELLREHLRAVAPEDMDTCPIELQAGDIVTLEPLGGDESNE